jgi:hypothetical protein
MQPVDGLDTTRDDSDTGSSTDDTHGGGNRDTELRSQDDGNGGSEFHRESTGRRVEGDFVTERDHHVVSVSSETNDDHGTTKGQHPNGGFGVFVGRETSVPDKVNRGKGTDGIGDIVGTVSESLSARGHDL